MNHWSNGLITDCISSGETHQLFGYITYYNIISVCYITYYNIISVCY